MSAVPVFGRIPTERLTLLLAREVTQHQSLTIDIPAEFEWWRPAKQKRFLHDAVERRLANDCGGAHAFDVDPATAHGLRIVTATRGPGQRPLLENVPLALDLYRGASDDRRL